MAQWIKEEEEEGEESWRNSSVDKVLAWEAGESEFIPQNYVLGKTKMKAMVMCACNLGTEIGTDP